MFTYITKAAAWVKDQAIAAFNFICNLFTTDSGFDYGFQEGPCAVQQELEAARRVINPEAHALKLPETAAEVSAIIAKADELINATDDKLVAIAIMHRAVTMCVPGVKITADTRALINVEVDTLRQTDFAQLYAHASTIDHWILKVKELKTFNLKQEYATLVAASVYFKIDPATMEEGKFKALRKALKNGGAQGNRI